jgi:hypothetical protein
VTAPPTEAVAAMRPADATATVDDSARTAVEATLPALVTVLVTL